MRNRHRTYQGRPLPRPQDEVVDQGLGFDLGTLLSRRRVLGLFGLGAAGLALSACTPSATGTAPASTSAAAASLAEIPEETAGPFPGDGSNGPDVLAQSGIVRGDIRSSFGSASATATGVPLTLELSIVDLGNGGRPFQGAAVYVWQCDALGRYSMYSDGVREENYLRGVQIADAEGRVRFQSIYPACYPGRWPHIHFEVYPDRNSITEVANVLVTSQVALPKDASEAVYAQPGYEQSGPTFRQVSLERDSVFRDDGGVSQLAKVTGAVGTGYTAVLRVGVDS
ncbi:intradiol ring-cleavage dioxygenase [Crossiella cryophila]|uniref:Protocatechuate 3,4-dioxygenase beta subunit n=1 Tax=Crossiella cryophila TaxID=43355 RepID=A0A7W7CC10_9PSEU|nr:intradiol ring-cleavage dioxygenase [Crossiella cryophila]MBB4678227.1 protocatechuate 3,4-dioxygenase beta subunit [Crossiella cryophila]